MNNIIKHYKAIVEMQTLYILIFIFKDNTYL